MKRVTLLDTVPLSGCDRAVTGTTTSGNKRTTALRSRISHLFLTASVLLIALLSSASMKAVGEKTIATLKTFTYQVDSEEAVAVTGFEANNFAKGGYTVSDLAFGKEVTLAGTVTDESDATAEEPAAVDVTIDPETGLGTATATLTVTAEDGTTKNVYTVNFSFLKAKITKVTAPEATQTLDNRVASIEDAIAQLAETVTIEAEDETTSLDITWEYTGIQFSTAAGKSNKFTWTATVPATLDANEQTLTGDVMVTNAATSTDAKLATLTYSIDGGEPIAVTGFETTHTNKEQAYTVALDGLVSPTAEITVAATASDEASIIKGTTTASLVENKATITLTVTPESGDGETRTITINFTRTPSDVATLASLTYQVGGSGEAVAVPSFAAEGTSYEVALPYNTPATADILVTPVTTSPYATYAVDEAVEDKSTLSAEAQPLTISLVEGEATLKFTVTSEDTKATQKVSIVFSTAKEKITAIEAPVAPKLTETLNEANTLLEVQKIEKVSVTLESGEVIELPVTWELKGGPFVATAGAKNTYTWTIAAKEYAAYELADGIKATDDMVVVNFVEAYTPEGEEAELTISDGGSLYNQIGDGEEEVVMKSVTVDVDLDALSFEKASLSGDVTINSGKTVGALSFNETTVTGKIKLDETVPTIVLSNATIGEIALAATKTTTLSLKAGNQIDKITNAGTLTLNNVEETKALAEGMTKADAALENKGAVKAVENNGVFTDNTATIVTVTGGADLAITALPQSKSTTGSSLELTVATATPLAGTISYQWQKFVNNAWVNANGEGNDAATLKVQKTGDGAGTFRCKVVNTNSAKITTLYTPSVTAAFNTSGGVTPPAPGVATYTVKLPKVTGATFSKTESTVVNEGDDFSFTITLDADYSDSKPVVKVDNATYEADANGNYVIKAIARDITIAVTGITKNIPTGIEEVLTETAVFGQDGAIRILPAAPVQVLIVNMAGNVVVNRTISEATSIAATKGVYIIRLSNNGNAVTHKVSVR